MASKEEVAQLKKTVQELRKGQLDILIRLETLEDKVAALEGGEVTPGKPEPILTCVQCSAEYKESENAEGGCKYHSSKLSHSYSPNHHLKCEYDCCKKSTIDSYDSARDLPGCTKGKHRSKHHTEYSYAGYYFYMIDLSDKAKQIWLTMDLKDHVTERCEWAEVGLSNEGKMFILVGSQKLYCGKYAEFSSEELRQCKEESFTVLEMSDSVGWAIKAEIQSCDSEANAITVSIKSASSSIPLVKRIGLYFSGDVPMPGKVECLSDPSPAKPSAPYTIPEPTYEGPVLDPGVDYSKDRKSDYETETTNNCLVKLQQHGRTEVDSSNFKLANGKWNNLFTATLKVKNTSQANLTVTEVYGEYINKTGEWEKCDDQWLGKEGRRGSYNWFDSTSFSMEPASTITLAARLCIAFADDPPNGNEACRRAHSSLPQPLHLRVTFVDHLNCTASLRFEQGNPPINCKLVSSKRLSQKETKFQLFADDTKKCMRSDAAIYYQDNDDITLMYRPVPCARDTRAFNIGSRVASAAYKAKVAGKEEFELTDMKMEYGGSTVQAFVVVDLEAGVAYAIKVIITTPTSRATGYYLLPYNDVDVSLASMTVEPKKGPVKSEFTVNWSVPRASRHDRIVIYPLYGRSSVASFLIRDKLGKKLEGETIGSIKLQAPDTPGQYEARYYPGWLKGHVTGYRHDSYLAPTTFTVSPAYHCTVQQPQ